VDGRPAHVHVAHRLLDAGASPRKRGGGKSVINAAAYAGDEGLFSRLVALGADIEQRDGSSCTPISSAVGNGSLKIVKFLLARGVDPNSPTPGGASVLVDAALDGHFEICKALVEAGADPNRGTDINFTPLMAACRFAHLNIVKYFLSLRIRVNEKDLENGRTVLDFVHILKQPPKFAPDVLRRLKKMGETFGPPRSRFIKIERLLRRAGAKTSAELSLRTSKVVA